LTTTGRLDRIGNRNHLVGLEITHVGLHNEKRIALEGGYVDFGFGLSFDIHNQGFSRAYDVRLGVVSLNRMPIKETPPASDLLYSFLTVLEPSPDFFPPAAGTTREVVATPSIDQFTPTGLNTRRLQLPRVIQPAVLYPILMECWCVLGGEWNSAYLLSGPGQDYP
jgi:hypothetical protein